MGDLISRSVAIEEIWNVFNSYVNDDSRFYEFETEAINRAFKVLQNRIEKQPTAYSVENVVAELEKQAEQYNRRARELVDKSTEAGIHNKGKACSYEHAINIVKRGGVDGKE